MKFSEVHGLDTLKQQLRVNVDNNRVPHAQLFIGPQGTGKLSLAYAFTQYLFCKDRQGGDSCGLCSSCRKIGSHSHPDVHYSYPSVSLGSSKKPTSNDFITQWREINQSGTYFNTQDWIGTIAKDENKAPNITKEETRNIISKLSLKPYEGEAKALIIWMPEYLGGESNALLKLIEEPPQKTYFILVAENSEALLSTITSRTQLVKVPRYTEEATKSFLQNKYSLDAKKAEQIAYLSEGNFRKAIDLVENVEDNYSAIFRDWMLACYTNNLQKVSSIVDGLHKLGKMQLQVFLANGMSILRESLLYSTIEDYEIKAESDQKDFIKNFSKTINASVVEKSYTQINEVSYHIQRNANAKLALFNLSLNLRYNFVRKK